MSDIIRLLPDHIANQIAAGEVIQRPASVVKELVENAIDAKATAIDVFIKHAGRTLIQVIDNGAGMTEQDARMAFERHATSKVSVIDDLFALKSLLCTSCHFFCLIFNSDVDNLSPRKLGSQDCHTENYQGKARAWDKYEDNPKQDQSRSDGRNDDPSERMG